MKNQRVWLTTGFCIFLLLLMVQCRLPGSPARQQQAPIQPIQPQDNNPLQQQDDNPVQQQDDDPIQQQDDNPVQQDNPPPAAQFQLEGIWEAQVETDYGTVYSELILEHTRTFSQQVVLGDLMTYDTGTYQVGDGFIHFAVTNHEPKVYKGKDMTWVNSFTYFYTPVDANSMTLEDHIAGTRWTVYRK
jgi:hypothetical protein